MMESESFEKLLAVTSQLDQHLPAVGRGMFTRHEFQIRQPIEEFHGAMVAQLQTPGVANSYASVVPNTGGVTFEHATLSGSGLVAFPEGELLNFLSGRSNPLRHALYLPGYLTDANEGEVLAELSNARPAAIVVWRRPAGEYGRGLFGEDYGRRIADWIRERA